MWARKLGIAPLWPSRVKIAIAGVLVTAFIYSFVAYLRGADVRYLDLTKPRGARMSCRKPGKACNRSDDPVACMLDQRAFFTFGVDVEEMLPTTCKGPSGACADLSLPIKSLTGSLGELHTITRALNPFEVAGVIFLILTSLLCGSILIHDLALLQEECRPRILSLRAAKLEMQFTWRCLSCLRGHKPMRRLREKSKCIWLILLPVWFTWHFFVFVIFMYPIILMASLFCIGIVRMSRILVFFTGILCICSSIIFIFLNFYYSADYYALFWDATDTETMDTCVCYCEFQLTSESVARMTLLAATVLIGSFSITFRSLKGLRRAEWAHLFSVLYSVPIEAFPVVWTRPADGGPIQHRKEGEPVQGEPAFDPFCLMDEQPESGRTRVKLEPVPLCSERADLWASVDEISDEEIGCCGFPGKLSRGSRLERSPKRAAMPLQGVVENNDCQRAPEKCLRETAIGCPSDDCEYHSVCSEDSTAEGSSSAAARAVPGWSPASELETVQRLFDDRPGQSFGGVLGKFDVIVCGTGFKECLLSGLLATHGRKVLHVDRNDYYGAEGASLDLSALWQKFRPNEGPPSELGANRDWNVDLIPKFVMASGKLVSILLKTKVSRYLEWKSVDGTFVYQYQPGSLLSRARHIHKVPANEKEAMTSPLMGPMEKGRCIRFFNFVEKWDVANPNTLRGISPQGHTMLHVFDQFRLDKQTIDFIGHALALFPNDDYLNKPCGPIIEKIQLYMTSIAQYGQSPFIYPMYGLSGLPEGFSRLAGLHNSTFMLRTPIAGFEYRAGKVCGIHCNGGIIKCDMVICDPSYVTEAKKTAIGRVIRAICILDAPIPETNGATCCQIIIPQRQLKRKNDIYISVMSCAHRVVPKGLHVAIVSTEVETGDAEAEIGPALKLLGPIREQFVQISDMYVPRDNGKGDGIFVTASLDSTSHFENATAEVLEMWKTITGSDLDLTLPEDVDEEEGEDEFCELDPQHQGQL